MPHVKAKVEFLSPCNKEQEIDFWTTSTITSEIEIDALKSLKKAGCNMEIVKNIEVRCNSLTDEKIPLQ